MSSSLAYRPSATATSTIPFYLRLMLTTIEPVLALGGVVISLTNPAQYLQTLTGSNPGLKASSSAFSFPSFSSSSISSLFSSGSATAGTGIPIAYDPRTHFLYTELAGAWLMFAFNEAVVMRLVDDVFVWTLLCWGMLLSDACYIWSTAEAMGGWAQFVQIGRWSAEDWVVFVTTSGPFLARVLVVLRVGFTGEGQQQQEVGEKKKGKKGQ